MGGGRGKDLDPKDKVSNRYWAAHKVPILLALYASMGSNDPPLQVTERQTKAQEGLSHPDGRAAQEEQMRRAKAPNAHGEKSLISMVRRILALGDISHSRRESRTS